MDEQIIRGHNLDAYYLQTQICTNIIGDIPDLAGITFCDLKNCLLINVSIRGH